MARNVLLAVELFSNDQSCKCSNLCVRMFHAAGPRHRLFRRTGLMRRGLVRAPFLLPPQPPSCVTGQPLPVALFGRSVPALHRSCSVAKFRGIMHLTYRDPLAHTGMVSAAPRAVEAGAPDRTAALEAAFHHWWARNDHFLSAGSCGDVVGLLEALGSAALTNPSSSSSSGSRAL